MSSVPPAASPSVDTTARARIRDEAIRCFAEAGVDATSVRTIASRASVSPALVMHHFGTKDNLRVACDRHVAALFREAKTQAVDQGLDLDPMGQIQAYDASVPIIHYLATTLVDGSPHVAELLDEMVDDAVGYTQRAIDNGLMLPSDDLRARTTVLMIWSMGALVLHEHVQRLLGVDLTGHPSDAGPYAVAAAEILGRPSFAPGIYERVRDAFTEQAKDSR